MDTVIDLSDASKALDLANIRFQLMYALQFLYLVDTFMSSIDTSQLVV